MGRPDELGLAASGAIAGIRIGHQDAGDVSAVAGDGDGYLGELLGRHRSGRDPDHRGGRRARVGELRIGAADDTDDDGQRRAGRSVPWRSWLKYRRFGSPPRLASAADSAAVGCGFCGLPMTRAVGIPSEAAKTAS